MVINVCARAAAWQGANRPHAALVGGVLADVGLQRCPPPSLELMNA